MKLCFDRMFHVSKHDLGEKTTLEARIPWLCNLDTEGNVPRICVSPLIHHCLRAVSSGVNNFNVKDVLEHARIDIEAFEQIEEYVERIPYIRGQTVYYTEDRPFVPPACGDFRKNREHWFLKNTDFKRVGYIDLEYLISERKVRVINNVSEIDSKIMLTIAKNVRITYTPNSVEYFRNPNLKGTKCQNQNSNMQITSSALLPA